MTRMKAAALLIMGAYALPVPALAADISAAPAPVEPFFTPAPAWSWDGCHVGLNAGYGWGDFTFRNNAVSSMPADTYFGGTGSSGFAAFGAGASGLVAGGQVGCTVQSDRLVFGIEGDLQYADIDAFAAVGPAFPPAVDPTGAFSAGAHVATDWIGTVRGRIGYAFDRLMVYGTGGVAFGRVDAELAFFDNFFTPADTVIATDRSTHVGYVVGAGIEGLISENVSARLEYLYVDLGRETFNFSYSGVSTAGFNAAAEAKSDIRFDAHLLRAGLNYRFSW